MFPVSKVRKGVDIIDRDYQPVSDLDKENRELPQYISRTCSSSRNTPKESERGADGSYNSLQLVGRRFEDEEVIAVIDYLKRKSSLPFIQVP